MTSDAPKPTQVSLRALVRLGLFYGVAGFGGGYSVLAQLRRELVETRRWVGADEFLVYAELSKSLPGTPATSLLALLGQRVAGVRGGVVTAGAFLLPSTVLMIACGAAYSLMRKAQGLGLFFDGMNAAMVGVVAATTLDLARSALRSRGYVVAAAVCAVLLASRLVSEPVLAAAAITIGVARSIARPPKAGAPTAAAAPASDDAAPKSTPLHGLALPALLIGGGVGVLAGLVRVFVPIGVMTFGGGLAMVPAIEHTVVVEQHWLGPKSFADAVALGQITPGPVAICATFIGYRVGGIVGALVATVAMFGPALALALAVGRSVERFRDSHLVAGALHALAPAVIGMLAAATYSLGAPSFEHLGDIVIAILAFGVLFRFKISPLWPLVTGGLLHLAGSLLFR